MASLVAFDKQEIVSTKPEESDILNLQIHTRQQCFDLRKLCLKHSITLPVFLVEVLLKKTLHVPL